MNEAGHGILVAVQGAALIEAKGVHSATVSTPRVEQKVLKVRWRSDIPCSANKVLLESNGEDVQGIVTLAHGDRYCTQHACVCFARVGSVLPVLKR